MSDKVLPFHTTDQPVILEGPTFDKVADCLIELANREARQGKATHWLDTIMEIGEECPSFAYRLAREMGSLMQQGAAIIGEEMEMLKIIRQVREAAKADGRYEVEADKGDLAFVSSDLPAGTKRAKAFVFPITSEGLKKALEWLKLPTEEQGL